MDEIDLPHFLDAFREALLAVNEPRLFETERGYQGALLVQLQNRLAEVGLPGDPIVEQEYQKRIPAHGIRIRPDIIIHVPFERGGFPDRKHGNFVAIEIKLRATSHRAEEDFKSLRLLREQLNYALTVFVNIDSDRTYSDLSGADQDVAVFAVRLSVGPTGASTVEIRES